MRAFLKIAGGKRSLLETLVSLLPQDFFLKKYNYVEPFIGGGSLYLHLIDIDKALSKRSVINDFNKDIWNVWQQVRQYPEHIIEQLNKLKSTHSKEQFQSIRSGFVPWNEAKFRAAGSLEESELSSPEDFRLDRASKFIYLNKTCYNGLIRYNKSGWFNSPYGNYDNPQLIDPINIQLCSQSIQKTKIYSDDFEQLFRLLFSSKQLKKDTFVYFDPPYIPTSLTSNFVNYTSNGFGLYDQYRLKGLLDFLNKQGIKFMLSNSDTPITREIFGTYPVVEVSNLRSISCKADGRKTVKELIFKNY